MSLTNTLYFKKSLFFMGALIGLGIFFAQPVKTYAATIEVNSKADTIADTGTCTLREAIVAANSNTASGATAGECVAGEADPTVDVIEFAIIGTANYTIDSKNGYTLTPGSDYPVISEAVTLDAYAQPGALRNSANVGYPFNGVVLITLDMSAANSAGGAFNAQATPGVTISGFSIVNSAAGGIAIINGSDDSVVTGNLIGVHPDGTIGSNSSAGVGIIDSSRVRVGGSSAGDRNVISANGVQGLGNIYIGSGGGTPSAESVVRGNYLGTDLSGGVDSAFTAANGVGINASAGTGSGLIGGANPQEANIIAGNRGAGVAVSRMLSPSNSLDVSAILYSIIGNSIYGTDTLQVFGVQSNLGIDHINLVDNDGDFNPDSFITGPNINDVGDGDIGANGQINYPVLNSVSTKDNGSKAVINYSLDAADSPTGEYRVEFFGNDGPTSLGYGEGQTLLGTVTVSNGANQQTEFSLPAGYSLEGKYIAATTTAVDATTFSGFGSTSEFSKSIQFISATSALAATGTNQDSLRYIAYATCSVAILALVYQIIKTRRVYSA